MPTHQGFAESSTSQSYIWTQLRPLGIRDYLIPDQTAAWSVVAQNRPIDGDKAVWFNNVDESTLIEAARPHFETVMQKNFVGWVKSGAYVDYLWARSKSRVM